MGKEILRMTNISKSFSFDFTMKDVNFDLREGEVHVLMGENGAGKSTLMKILAGVIQKDSGEIEIFGEKVEINSVKDAESHSIGFIHQELNLIPHLSIAQNIYLGREPRKCGVIDDKKMVKDTNALLKKLGMDFDPTTKVNRLAVGSQQLVEIAKAISFESKILIMDEPTAALSIAETEMLFEIMKDLSKKGIGMIYISHRMDEIMRVSDRISVMRDGIYVGTKNTAETTKEEIIKMMVGREVSMDKKEKSNCPPDSPIALEMKHLYRGKHIKDVSMYVKKGEILGLAGLMGSGRTAIVRAIFGADKRHSGDILLNGKEIKINSPKDAIKNGICYISEDRARFGLMLRKSIAENTAIATLEHYAAGGIINDKIVNEKTVEVNNSLNTKYGSVFQPVGKLSGGNQQKIIIGRWLLTDAQIYIFDEPTRGIDIGAKSEIYGLMEKLAREGKSIIVVSSELAEIQRVSDRVYVMSEGRITANLDISEATQETIMSYATKEINHLS